jgi:glycosyltransferase involved in cell wall biosynthesis
MKQNEFCVLMSLYHKENAVYFDMAMKSIWMDQTLKPSQIVLVLDGPLTHELDTSIENWTKVLGDILTLVPLKENVGLGWALNEGLKHCKYEIIARMDTDDVSMHDRFKHQITFLEDNPDIDVVGTFISEMDEEGHITRPEVQYPLEHNKLRRMFVKRDPLPHMTVMFRSSFFQKAGPYSGELRMAEDTLLWYRGFSSNCKFANIPVTGVIVRQSASFYDRRGDLTKSVNLLMFRLKTINNNLGYGLKGNVYALAYFFLCMSPSTIKKLLYRYLR